MLNEFKNFIAKGNVMDMAVGIIVGAAFTAIVSSMVADLINPIIGLIIGGIDFSNMYVVLSGNVAPGTGLETARESGAAVFAYGSFIMAVWTSSLKPDSSVIDPMRPFSKSYRQKPVAAFDSRCWNDGVGGYRRPQCTRRLRP